MIHDEDARFWSAGVKASCACNRQPDPRPIPHTPRTSARYMQMIETADIVAQCYGISRMAQDALTGHSPAPTAAVQGEGRLPDEIAPITVDKQVTDKATSATCTVTSRHGDDGHLRMQPSRHRVELAANAGTEAQMPPAGLNFCDVSRKWIIARVEFGRSGATLFHVLTAFL